MLNLIQRFFTKEKTDRAQTRINFSHYFFSLPEHAWISQAEKNHFEKLFSLLPSSLLESLMTKYPVTFIRSEDMQAQHVPGKVLSNTIVVFPEFQKLLSSKKRSAVAYLAHELAFVVYELEVGGKDTLMAEIEADKFVVDLGLVFELEDLLLVLDETVEKRLRLTYLTVHHFTGNN